MDDQIALAKMHYWMAILELVSRDDRESARAYLLNTTEHQSDRCAPVDVAMSQMTLAQLESDEGHHRSALRRLQESARLLLRCGNGACMANVIAQAGVVCFWLGHTDSATQLLEYYRSARSAPQTPPEGYLAYIQETADKSRYRRNIEVGRAMSSRDAVDLVLSTA
jgi:hypothetical protein